eukprot:1141203-Pelagomonas_calceolata.AAC.2
MDQGHVSSISWQNTVRRSALPFLAEDALILEHGSGAQLRQQLAKAQAEDALIRERGSGARLRQQLAEAQAAVVAAERQQRQQHALMQHQGLEIEGSRDGLAGRGAADAQAQLTRLQQQVRRGCGKHGVAKVHPRDFTSQACSISVSSSAYQQCCVKLPKICEPPTQVSSSWNSVFS